MIPELPEDAKSEREVAQLCQGFRTQNDEFHAEFFERMEEAFGIYEGSKHWHWGKVKDTGGNEVWASDVVEAKGLPALVKNETHPLVRLLCGLQAQEPTECGAIGRSKGDAQVATDISALLKWQWQRGRGERALVAAFGDMVVCGRGWVSAHQVEHEDNMLETFTQFQRVDPAEIRYDPATREYDLSDCMFLERNRVMPRSQAKLLWPEKSGELTAFWASADRNYYDATSRVPGVTARNTVLISEYWYRQYVQRLILWDHTTGAFYDISDLGEEGAAQLMAETQGTSTIIRKPRRVMFYAYTAGPGSNVVLDHGRIYNDNFFPYVPLFCYQGRNGDYGVIHNIRDAQRERNKRDSQILHWINKSPKARVIVDDETTGQILTSEMEIITVPKGTTVQTVQPPTVPPALPQLIDRNKDDIKHISGINDELQGTQRGANEAGITISLRQRQGMLMVASIFDNVQASQEILGHIGLSRIRQYLPPESIARILGDEATPERVAACKAADSELFDLVVTQKSSSPTVRVEEFQKLMELLKTGLIPPGPAVTETVIDAADITEAEKLKQAVMQTAGGMPAGPADINTAPPADSGGMSSPQIGSAGPLTGASGPRPV